MPTLPPRPCASPGCPAIGYCPKHAKIRVSAPTPQPRLYDDRRGSSAQRGYGYAWQKKRRDYLIRHPLCVRCGKPATDVDHVLARRFGGSEDEGNLQALCSYHHKQKTVRERRMM